MNFDKINIHQYREIYSFLYTFNAKVFETFKFREYQKCKTYVHMYLILLFIWLETQHIWTSLVVKYRWMHWQYFKFVFSNKYSKLKW